jgi:hypothetical protein
LQVGINPGAALVWPARGWSKLVCSPLANHPNGFLIVAVIVLNFAVVAGWLAFRRCE